MNLKFKPETTRELVLSALVIAFYVVVMYLTQSFSFGQYQIRIATSIYALSAVKSFLIVPLALANLLSNLLLGGLGPLDTIGGACAGLLTSFVIAYSKAKGWSNFWIALAITFGPGLLVPIWLSVLLNIPYLVLMPAIVIGQIIPGIVGVIAVAEIERRTASKCAVIKN